MSLADQLSKVKLKKSSEPTKDFSDPMLAGFVNDAEVRRYQHDALEVNAERWLTSLQHLTFPTRYCPISIPDAQLFIDVYVRTYKDKTPGSVPTSQWRKTLSDDERKIVDDITARLGVAMDTFLKEDRFVFVKTSSRSAKDTSAYEDKFKQLYADELKKLSEELQKTENEQISCLLKAAFQALKMRSPDEVLNAFMSSERIYQDFLLATEHKDRFEENFVIRKFVEIDIDMEFRGFVYEGELVAVSQYNYLIHSAQLCKDRQRIMGMLTKFYEEKVKPCMGKEGFPKSYVIDFAVCQPDVPDPTIWVIELNPFLVTTDGALFSWEHELHILHGEAGFQFRLTERPKPGAKTMLPYSVRQMIK